MNYFSLFIFIIHSDIINEIIIFTQDHCEIFFNFDNEFDSALQADDFILKYFNQSLKLFFSVSH